jgi:hypothetical protein
MAMSPFPHRRDLGACRGAAPFPFVVQSAITLIVGPEKPGIHTFGRAAGARAI